MPEPTLVRAASRVPLSQLLAIRPLKVELVFSEPTCQVVVPPLKHSGPQGAVAVEFADLDRPAGHLSYRGNSAAGGVEFVR